MRSRDDISTFLARIRDFARPLLRNAIAKRAVLVEVAIASGLTLVVCKFVNWDIPNICLRGELGAEKGVYSAVKGFVASENERASREGGGGAALIQPTNEQLEEVVLFGLDPTAGSQEQAVSAFVSRPLVASRLAAIMVKASTVDGAKERAKVSASLDESIKPAYEGFMNTVAFAWRRYTTGWVQYTTIFFFLVAAVRMGFWRYWLGVEHATIVGKNLPRCLRAVARYGQGIHDEPRNLRQRVAEAAPEAFGKTLREFRDDMAQPDLPAFRCAPLLNRLEKECDSHSRNALATHLPIIDAGIEQLERQFDIENHLIRWLIAALPALGFVGTILGIGSGLGQADKPIGAVDKAGRIAAVQDLTSALGVAFDTTLIALLLSLVATALMMMNERLRGQYLFDLRSVLLDGPGEPADSKPEASTTTS